MGAIADISTSRSRMPAVNLDAEKAKCERQLADWVHCVSASTPQGKAKIEEFSAKLRVIDARIKAVDAAAVGPAAALNPAATAATPATALGSVVDVFV